MAQRPPPTNLCYLLFPNTQLVKEGLDSAVSIYSAPKTGLSLQWNHWHNSDLMVQDGLIFFNSQMPPLLLRIFFSLFFSSFLLRNWYWVKRKKLKAYERVILLAFSHLQKGFDKRAGSKLEAWKGGTWFRTGGRWVTETLLNPAILRWADCV